MNTGLNELNKRFYRVGYQTGTKKLTVTTTEASIIGIIFVKHNGGTNFYSGFYIRGFVIDISKSGTTGAFNSLLDNTFEYTVNVPVWSLGFLSISPVTNITLE